MSENTKNELALQDMTFELPDVVDSGDFTNEELAEDMAGLQLSFPRVKIPAGGGLQYELAGDDPENPDYEKTLKGIIVYHHASNAYWPEGMSEDENASPICSSSDGCTGVGAPGGSCKICSFNMYGTGEDGKGKACKNMRQVYLLRDGDYLPLQLALPPTSLKPFSDFLNTAFISRRRGVCGSIVEIGLRRVDNGHTYSVATFKKVGDFTGEMLAQVKAYSTTFKEQMKAIIAERSAEADAKPPYDYENYVQQDGGVAGYDTQEVEDLPFGPPDAGYAVQPVEDLPFDISGSDATIDGNVESLPA